PRHLEAATEAGELSAITRPPGSIRSSGVLFLDLRECDGQGIMKHAHQRLLRGANGDWQPLGLIGAGSQRRPDHPARTGTAHDPDPLETALELTRLVRAEYESYGTEKSHLRTDADEARAALKALRMLLKRRGIVFDP